MPKLLLPAPIVANSSSVSLRSEEEAMSVPSVADDASTFNIIIITNIITIIFVTRGS